MNTEQQVYVRSFRIEPSILEEEEYYVRLPAVQHLQKRGALSLQSPVTFLVGENGTGKSTLLEALAVCCGFNPEGGSINFNFSSRASHSGLHRRLQLVRAPIRPKDGFFLRAESFYNVATEIERMDEIPAFTPQIISSYGGKSLHEQSHGESFMALMLNRFGGKGLYILDEPEAALSPSRQMALLAAIHGLVGKASQFIISTHSPILMAYPGALIYELKEQELSLTPYKETEHYQVSRRFLEASEKMLHYLFEE